MEDLPNSKAYYGIMVIGKQSLRVSGMLGKARLGYKVNGLYFNRYYLRDGREVLPTFFMSKRPATKIELLERGIPFPKRYGTIEHRKK
jgi:hypothetical protein